jgi:hypothetical protein
MDKMTTTNKLNEALGITSNESIDDVIKEFDDELLSLKTDMTETVDKIDASIEIQDIHSMKETFGELSDLIGSAKSMLVGVHDYVSSSEILDPDVLRAGADLIKSSREVISEYLNVYKQKMQHFQNIEMEMIKLENKKNFEKYKHSLKLELLDDNNTGDDYIKYNQESVVKVIDEYEKK